MNSLTETREGLQLATAGTRVPIGTTTKRLVDIFLALFGIVLLAPLFVICFAATRLTSRGPALFRHRRIGFNGKPFDCLKFRTMVTDASERLQHLLDTDPSAASEWATNRKLKKDPRITAIGTVLRKSSLDELPQLFNVLWGDMSIVGPRPVTAEELERYANSVYAYLSCRPRTASVLHAIHFTRAIGRWHSMPRS
jgi:exopolysaccharide production protein ExoY